MVAICAYPLVRRLTRRLERLQAGVESLGAGDLSARVKVEGKDEVARLAESFNRAAARIEELVSAHKMLLANASHELRTPLSRIRLGIELMKDSADPERKAALEKDIAELDGLIDQILLSSRLDAVKARRGARGRRPACARRRGSAPATSSAPSPALPSSSPAIAACCSGMMRNLLDNAERHGAPPIEVDVRLRGSKAVLSVVDHGAGVETRDRERIFTPFYRTAGSSVPEPGWALPWSARLRGSTAARRIGSRVRTRREAFLSLSQCRGGGSPEQRTLDARASFRFCLSPHRDLDASRGAAFTGNGRTRSGRP